MEGGPHAPEKRPHRPGEMRAGPGGDRPLHIMSRGMRSSQGRAVTVSGGRSQLRHAAERFAIDPDVSLFTETAVEDATRPTEFALEQNYPNPLSEQTTIRFSLPQATRVRLVVYDVLGRSVTTLVNGEKGIGNYIIRWDGRDASGTPLPSGMYLYRIQAAKFTQTRNMTLLR